MACFDSNTLTSDVTGKLLVNLKANSGLAAANDGTGIYVDFANTGIESGLHLYGGKLSTYATPSLDHYKSSASGSAGYSPLPIGAGGAVTTVAAGTISFTNITPYSVLYIVTARFQWDVDCLYQSEWRGNMILTVNGSETSAAAFKFRNDMIASGGGGAIGERKNYSFTEYFLVPPAGGISFACLQRHYSSHGTVQLQSSWCYIEAYGIAMPIF